MLRRPIAAAGAALALALAAPAVASPGWTSPATLGTESNYALAVDRDGKALILGARLDPGVAWSVTSHVHPVGAGSSWTSQIVAQDDCGACIVLGPTDAAVDDQGDAVGTWAHAWSGPGNADVTVATRAAGGTWTPVALSPGDTLVWNTDQSVAKGPDGTALLVTTCLYCDNNGGALIAARAVAQDEMAPRAYLSAVGEQPSTPVAGIDAAGRATVAWRSTLGIRVASRSLAGTWSAPVTVSSGDDQWAPALAVSPSGGAELAWVGSDDVVRSARRTGPGDAWSAPAVVTTDAGAKDADHWSNPPVLAIDSGEKAVLTWTGSDGKVRGAVRPAGAGWTTTVIPLSGTSPRVAVNPAGTAFLLFLGPTGAPRVSIRPAGGSWSASAAIGGNGALTPRIAADANGDAVAGWIDADGVLRASAFDATAPVMADLAVPSSAVAGTPVVVSVVPWDLWSSVDSVAWDFGDGATGSGPQASHVYAAAGTYAVTASAADAFGNVASVHRDITITAPVPVTPAPTPGPSGTVGGVTAGLPGGTPGGTAAPLTPAAARRLSPLRIRLSGTGGFRAGDPGVLRVRLSRRVSGALLRVKLRRGTRYTTVVRGRVSGSQVPVALLFRSAGRFSVRVQIIEAHRPVVTRAVEIRVRR